MFSKFGQQLKPINRSSSENRREQTTSKPNYHFTQKRERSESKGHQLNPVESTLKPQTNLIQSVPIQPLNIKLPDIKGYNKQLEKSTSGFEINKKPPLIKNRIIIDSKKQQQTNLLTQTLPPQKNPREDLQLLNSAKQKIKMNYFSQTRAGFDGIQDKTNQDRELCLQFDENNSAFAVMDGHGMDGDYVSTFVKELLKYNLTKFYKVFDFQKVFQDIHQKMKLQTEFGCQFSGTTLTLVLIRDQIIQCGWVGDSRAIMAKRKNEDQVEVVELSFDHKPHLEGEKLRIEASGGMVDTYHLPNGAPIGPSRVWAKGAAFPGLAMSRSLGDLVAAAVGVSQVPDIKCVDFGQTNSELFLVLGSDGIWEFLDNQIVADLIYPFYLKNDPQGACQKVIQEAVAGWKAHSEGIDDITIIIVFFNY